MAFRLVETRPQADLVEASISSYLKLASCLATLVVAPRTHEYLEPKFLLAPSTHARTEGHAPFWGS